MVVFDRSTRSYDGYFVDLFVRVSNTPAIRMYEKVGYSVYRRVLGYYHGENDLEDAFGTSDLHSSSENNVSQPGSMPLAVHLSSGNRYAEGALSRCQQEVYRPIAASNHSGSTLNRAVTTSRDMFKRNSGRNSKSKW